MWVGEPKSNNTYLPTRPSRSQPFPAPICEAESPLDADWPRRHDRRPAHSWGNRPAWECGETGRQCYPDMDAKREVGQDEGDGGFLRRISEGPSSSRPVPCAPRCAGQMCNVIIILLIPDRNSKPNQTPAVDHSQHVWRAGADSHKTDRTDTNWRSLRRMAGCDAMLQGLLS